jgi:AhpD family alkylhydroperoxidase
MNAREYYATSPQSMGAMKRELPEIAGAFHAFHQQLMAEGAISQQQKELIAIGISIAIRCESCIYSHVQRARKIGASREEILDAAGVAAMMQGGPGYAYLPKVIDALDALQASELLKPASAAR